LGLMIHWMPGTLLAGAALLIGLLGIFGVFLATLPGYSYSLPVWLGLRIDRIRAKRLPASGSFVS
jgi:hypothetical protein